MKEGFIGVDKGSSSDTRSSNLQVEVPEVGIHS
jgi:hypothetical protein